jgi:hypothetical protein
VADTTTTQPVEKIVQEILRVFDTLGELHDLPLHSQQLLSFPLLLLSFLLPFSSFSSFSPSSSFSFLLTLLPGIKHKKVRDQYIYTGTTQEQGEVVKIELEIVSINKFTNLRGIVVRRSVGDVWAYKAVYEKIVKELKV